MLKKIKLKKSQVEMMQSVAVLFVFFLLVGFGIIVYSKMQKGSMRENINEFESLRAVETSQMVSYLTELECSINSVSKDNCIDKLKMEHFIYEKNMSADTILYYRSVFGNTRVWLTEIYPGNQTWLIYSNILEGNISQRLVQVPIILYHPISNYSNDFSFAVLNVEVYLEEKLA